MSAVVEVAEFEVPRKEATSLGGGSWVWDLSSWRGVREISLDGTLALAFGGEAILTVKATPTALKKVRKFCGDRGYKELSPEDMSE